LVSRQIHCALGTGPYLIATPMAEHHRHRTWDLRGTVMVSLCRFRVIALYLFAGYGVVPVLSSSPAATAISVVRLTLLTP
jgi:hypothetical protein